MPSSKGLIELPDILSMPWGVMFLAQAPLPSDVTRGLA